MNSSRFFGRYIRFGVAFFFAVLLIVALSGPVMAQFGVQFDDQEGESGEAESETAIGIDGNNNNQCVGLLQFQNTGNFFNQQGWVGGDGGFFDGHDDDDDGPYDNRFRDDDDDGRDDDDGEWEIDIEGPEITFAPENETTCEQAVQQASSASSVTYNYYFDGWYFWWWDAYWAGWWYSSDLVNWYWNGP